MLKYLPWSILVYASATSDVTSLNIIYNNEVVSRLYWNLSNNKNIDSNGTGSELLLPVLFTEKQKEKCLFTKRNKCQKEMK